MFVVQVHSDENLNNFIYDSPFPMGSGPERSQFILLNVLATLKGTGAYINFFNMQVEKENVATEAYTALLYHVWEMIPSNPDERETMRDHLKEIYLNFMHGEGGDLTNEKEEFIKLYWCFDWFLKLCKNVDSEAFIKFLQEKEI